MIPYENNYKSIEIAFNNIIIENRLVAAGS